MFILIPVLLVLAPTRVVTIPLPSPPLGPPIPPCQCPDGVMFHLQDDCRVCVCDANTHYFTSLDCIVPYCVNTTDDCCPNCPNGENCLAEVDGMPSQVIPLGPEVVVGDYICLCEPKYFLPYAHHLLVPKATCSRSPKTPPPPTSLTAPPC